MAEHQLGLFENHRQVSRYSENPNNLQTTPGPCRVQTLAKEVKISNYRKPRDWSEWLVETIYCHKFFFGLLAGTILSAMIKTIF